MTKKIPKGRLKKALTEKGGVEKPRDPFGENVDAYRACR
jgi:hypothetical protein